MRMLQRSACLSLLLFALLFQSGCSLMFARDDMPDLGQVVIGAERASIESQLGDPIMNVRTGAGQSGERKCTYKVLVKAKNGDNASAADKVARSFVGFHTYEYQVIYDRGDRAVSVKALSEL